MAAKLEKTKYPGIYRRGSRYVIVWYYRGTQHRESCASLSEAIARKAAKATGSKRPKKKLTFGNYFPTWIDSYAGRTSRGFSETTRPEYARPIEQDALPAWEDWQLLEIEPGDVRELFGQMRREGRSTSKIKKLRAALSVLFATAVEDRLVPTNPVSGVRIPAPPADEEEPEERVKALTRSDLGILLNALPGEWRLFFEFLTHTGLRISEAVGLRWEHMDLSATPQVHVREQLYKGKRKRLKSRDGKRDLPLSPGMTRRLLALRRDNYAGPTSPVFQSSTGTPLRPDNVYRRVLAPAAISVGLVREIEVNGTLRLRSSVSFHTFRHTCASLLFDAGRNVKQIQEWLGHADPSFTLSTYVHLMDAGIGSADFLDGAVPPSGRTPASQLSRRSP